MYINARRKIDDNKLDEFLVYKNLRNCLPRLNDYAVSETNYREELKELNDFGIFTNKQLRLLLKKHRKMLVEIDQSPMDGYHKAMYKAELGEDFNQMMKWNVWFAFPGLLRIALELEFGIRYEEYANKRDGI